MGRVEILGMAVEAGYLVISLVGSRFDSDRLFVPWQTWQSQRRLKRHRLKRHRQACLEASSTRPSRWRLPNGLVRAKIQGSS